MSALAAVTGGVRAALGGLAGLNGVFATRPERASPPWGELAAVEERDWSAKGVEGREVRIALTLFDRGPGEERLFALSESATFAVREMASDLGGWRIASIALLGARHRRRTDGLWMARIEWRVRVMRTH